MRILNLFMQSDGNWFSKFFVTKIWAPLQALLRINPNTPAYDQELKTEHNRMMYEWAMQQTDLILITGHTHQPVFESLTHFERLQLQHHKALYEHNPQWAEAIENEGRSEGIDLPVKIVIADDLCKGIAEDEFFFSIE